MGMPRENRRFLLPHGNMVFNLLSRYWLSLERQIQRDAFDPESFGAELMRPSTRAS
jgi:hypothetical protein